MEDDAPAAFWAKQALEVSLRAALQEALAEATEKVCASVLANVNAASPNSGSSVAFAKRPLPHIISGHSFFRTETRFHPASRYNDADVPYVEMKPVSSEEGSNHIIKRVPSITSLAKGRMTKGMVPCVRGSSISNHSNPLFVSNERHTDERWVERLVLHHAFEPVVGVLVLLNAVCLGIDTDIQCAYGGDPPRFWDAAIITQECFFCIMFTLELLCRLLAYGSGFLHSYWNVFDSIVVAVQVWDVASSSSRWFSKGRSHLLGMAMIFRLLRLIRLVRLFRLFEHLGILMLSIIRSTSSVIWALVLIFIILYSCAVLLSQLAIEADPDFNNHSLKYWFGSVPRALLTMLESIIGGVNWDVPATLLLNDVGLFPGIFFCIYVTLAYLVLLNVVTGVFIDQATRTSRDESDIRTAEAISEVFKGDDVGDSGHFSAGDFLDKLEEPALKAYFETLNLDTSEASTLFNLLDRDGSGTVDSEEIVSGCLRLKGQAKAFDVAVVLQNQLHMFNEIAVIASQVTKIGSKYSMRKWDTVSASNGLHYL